MQGVICILYAVVIILTINENVLYLDRYSVHLNCDLIKENSLWIIYYVFCCLTMLHSYYVINWAVNFLMMTFLQIDTPDSVDGTSKTINQKQSLS